MHYRLYPLLDCAATDSCNMCKNLNKLPPPRGLHPSNEEKPTNASAGNMIPLMHDPHLENVLNQIVQEFLATRTNGMTKLDVALLIPMHQTRSMLEVMSQRETWLYATHNGETLWYPASVVKLAYLAAAMNWCKKSKLPFDHLDSCVRPMIERSCNVHTGVVVDKLSVPNTSAASPADGKYVAWLAKRKYTENYLKGFGLLGNQRIVHKTYPTNSGATPTLAEGIALRQFGRNLMTPLLTANLLLHVVKDRLEPGSASYARKVLTHDRWKPGSALGFGLPPGSIYENKVGVAYGLLHDVAYVVLPNNREFVLCAFSNGYESNQPSPYDYASLGVLCDNIIEKLRLDENLAIVRLDTGTAGSRISTVGQWETGTKARDKRGKNFLFKAGRKEGEKLSSVTFHLNVPQGGKYEVCVYYPNSHSADGIYGTKRRAASAPHTIYHTGGLTTVRIDQNTRGGRWVKLGEFSFGSGQGKVTVSDDIASPLSVVICNAVKASLIKS